MRYKGRSREGGVASEGLRWCDGIFVGIHRRTNQYLVFDAVHDIRQAKTVMIFPDELKFDVDMAQAVNITLQHVHDSSAQNEYFTEPIFLQAPIPGVGIMRGHSKGAT